MQNKDTLVNLIKAVKTHPKLFTYLAESSEDDLEEWTAVAQQCKITISEAQDQWSLLLMDYVEYLKNNKNFELAQHMDFLQPFFFTVIDNENIDQDELLKAINFKSQEENVTCLEPECTNLNTSTAPGKGIKIEETEKSEMKPTIFTENKKCNVASESTAIPQGSLFTNLSSVELIFLGYAKQLQKMPLALQLKTKRKIADIMDEVELQSMG